MDIAARLTTEWGDDPTDPAAALWLNSIVRKGHDFDSKALARALPENGTILGLDRLFRRTQKGFDSIKSFVGALSAIPDTTQNSSSLVCEIDVFAYAFLKGAKNFDLVLPALTEYPEPHKNFQSDLKKWHATIASLEHFERVGRELPHDIGTSADDYLRLRRVVTRASARDELRVLATLMISGPSTTQQIETELGLSVSLTQRIVATLHKAGVLKKEDTVPDQSDSLEITIASESIPLVVFCLRETLGLDLLALSSEGIAA